MKTVLICWLVTLVLYKGSKFIAQCWASEHTIEAIYEEYPLWLYLIAFTCPISSIVSLIVTVKFILSL